MAEKGMSQYFYHLLTLLGHYSITIFYLVFYFAFVYCIRNFRKSFYFIVSLTGNTEVYETSLFPVHFIITLFMLRIILMF